MNVQPAIVELLYAVGIGLFVGFEREHKDLSEDLPPGQAPVEGAPADEDDAGRVGPTPARRPPVEVLLGVRTFAMLALVGWLLAYLGAGSPALLPVGVGVVGAFLMVQYVLGRHQHGLGITTEVAAVVVFLLGALVRFDRALAVAIGLGTALLLVAKPWMRSAVVRLRRIEITATIQLLILIAIVLPMLPTEAVDRWDLLPPRKIGLFIVLIAGVGYVGYVATRFLGPHRGAGVTGLLGGLVSSTATTVTMARTARRDPGMVVPGQIATFLANATMCVRVLVVCTILSTTVGLRLFPALGGMAVVMLGGGALRWRALRRAAGADPQRGQGDGRLELQNPFALFPALKWGVVLCVILVLVAAGRYLFGDNGLLAAAAIGGLADVDAITLAAVGDASSGAISSDFAALAIVLAVITNTIAKGALAMFAGGRRFGVPVVVVFAAAVAVSGALAVIAALAG